MKPQTSHPEQITHKLFNNTLTISGKGAMLDYECSEAWRNYKDDIVTVVIEDGVVEIKQGVFSFYDNLTAINIPKSVTNIEHGALGYDETMETVNVDSNNPVYSSENGVLFDKAKTTLLFFPRGIKSQEYTIPKTVTEIDSVVFDIWENMTSIHVENENSVYSSKNGVLFNKSKTVLKLYPAAKTDKNYVIPSSVRTIGYGAFKYCRNLTAVTIPKSVKNIRSYAFSNCSGLISITIPNAVRNIEDSAFYGCSNLISITIPPSVKNIGYDTYGFWGETFGRCASLIAINVDENNPTYSSCDGILFNKEKTLLIRYPAAKTDSNYFIPDGVVEIERNAFENCANLTSVNIPDSVTKIGSSAFRFCRALTSVNIGNGVVEIGSWAFGSCKNLISINIPDSVTMIDSYAFENCSNLTSINIPNSIKEIAHKAFSGCTALTSARIPDSVTNIEDYAFGGCGKSCANCGSAGCTGLTSVTIPKNVEKIGRLAFRNCKGLISIEVDKDNAAFCSENGVLFDKEKTTLLQYPSSKTDTNYIIPDSVTQIGDYAFCECKNVTAVMLPNGLITIGGAAFANCKNLTAITIPDSVTNIGDEAFEKSGLTAIFIPKSVAKIEESAFGRCSNLTSFDVDADNPMYSSENGVLFNKDKTLLIQFPQAKSKIDSVYTIPDSVAIIGKNAFFCSWLYSVTIPNGVTTIENTAFCGCYRLNSITIPSSVTTIKGGFWGSLSLNSIDVNNDNSMYSSENGVLFNKSKTVLISYPAGKMGDYVIPDGVTSIGSSAFYCSKLHSISIPSSLTSMGQDALRSCKNLKHIILKCKNPPIINEIMYRTTFDDIDKNTCILHVPLGSKNKYANANRWKEFKNIMGTSKNQN